MTIESAKEKIEQAINVDGPYSHNIIGLVLSSIANQHGYNTANQLIDELNLADYGFSKKEG